MSLEWKACHDAKSGWEVKNDECALLIGRTGAVLIAIRTAAREAAYPFGEPYLTFGVLAAERAVSEFRQRGEMKIFAEPYLAFGAPIVVDDPQGARFQSFCERIAKIMNGYL